MPYDDSKTQCQDEFRNLSGCVLKILTASRMLQISIARCQIGGVDLVKIGEIKVSVQELGLKIMFFYDTNLDLLTLAGSGSPKFLGVVILETILKKMGNFEQNELWARPVASKLSERWPLSFFHRRDTENGQKCFSSHFSQLLQCENFQEVSRDAI